MQLVDQRVYDVDQVLVEISVAVFETKQQSVKVFTGRMNPSAINF